MRRHIGFGTKAVHVGSEPDHTGAVTPPIYLSSTFKQPDATMSGKYIYSRGANPTRERLEKSIASLEEAKYALAFSSGMAAIDAVLRMLKPGDHIIALDNLYGGTLRLLKDLNNRYNIKVTFTDLTNLENLEKAITPETKMVFLETPSNPLLKIVDIKEVSRRAHEKGLIVVVDNTFATPYNQRPLTLGADIVIHSLTKYLSGHSDIIGGAVALNNDEYYEKIYFNRISTGGILSPFDSWLTLRGIRTLHLRVERHNYNAMKIAEYLANHEKIEKVYYPGLKEHPGHEVAKRQMITPKGEPGYGGMVSFKLKADLKNTIKFLNSLRIITLAVSLGGVESLIHAPITGIYRHMSKEEVGKMGITENFIRFSVGVEDVEDLIGDLEQALRKID